VLLWLIPHPILFVFLVFFVAIPSAPFVPTVANLSAFLCVSGPSWLTQAILQKVAKVAEQFIP